MVGDDAHFAAARRKMVLRQIAARGVRSPAVLGAMGCVPRHFFVPAELRDQAYEDRPLPVGRGQTISQPYMVALMTELAAPGPADRVLEIGTGSGYQAAVLSLLAGEVHTVERLPELFEASRERLAVMGCGNVRAFLGDGSAGLPGHAPYDAVVVTAGAPDLPEALAAQVAEGGRIVAPVGPEDGQWLVAGERTGGVLRLRRVLECRFVPLLGVHGWPDA
ncbi:MAG TPA: protein-L-isoaspartate(D-aspartate) O-methyltransferase [Candidatus Hydrogenedentes bacterium]|nr:protein-L-isoaspartate(D-aspartate) O-methyltransferase [Candidatus Hydrogenedentota bacterium]HQL93936.1 protein-L-isoaspartate(D-aspartate) O-methyltransferase [Candidatus Hydrogenedentota bacterium]